MNTKPLIVGALAYLAIRTFAKVSAARSFRYDITGLPAVSYEAGRAVVRVPLSLTNPNSETFNIKKAYGRILVNGAYLGDFANDLSFTVQPFGRVDVPITLSLYLSNSVIALVELLTGKGNAGLTVAITGGITADSVTIPLEVSKKLL